MHTCAGCDTLHLQTRLWHGAYCRWYDADRAGRKATARFWGVIADRLANFA